MKEPELVAERVAAALATAVTPAGSFDYDEVPDALPVAYVEHTVDRQLAGSERMSGARVFIGWRITTRVVARHVRDARVLRRRVSSLEDRPIPGIPNSTRLLFESEEPIGPDGPDNDRWFSGLTTWTFEAPNTATDPG